MLEQERPNVKVGKGKDAQKLISIRKHNKVGGTPNIGYTFVNAHTHTDPQTSTRLEITIRQMQFHFPALEYRHSHKHTKLMLIG